jgi:hypothetical protein
MNLYASSKQGQGARVRAVAFPGCRAPSHSRKLGSQTTDLHLHSRHRTLTPAMDAVGDQSNGRSGLHTATRSVFLDYEIMYRFHLKNVGSTKGECCFGSYGVVATAQSKYFVRMSE